MKRRKSLLLAVAVAVSGCSTFSDNDAIARVGDVELSSEQLRERADARGAPQNEALDADAVRQEIGAWVGEQVAGRADAGAAAAAYPLGLTASGSICFEVLVAASIQDAADAVEELQAGADFATVYAAYNIDQSLDADVGRFGCVAEADLPLGTGNPFVESLLDLDAVDRFAAVELPGEPGQPAVAAVTRFIPFDELRPDETPIVEANLPVDTSGIDIYVDPRYGTYDAEVGAVVALG